MPAKCLDDAMIIIYASATPNKTESRNISATCQLTGIILGATELRE